MKANAPECSSGKSTNQLLRNVTRNFYRHEDNGAYYAERKINGKVIQRSLQTSDRAVANRKLRDWLAALDNRNPALEKTTLEQLFETFRGTFGGKAKKTRQTNESIAKRFKESWTLGMFGFPPSSRATFRNGLPGGKVR